MTNKQRDVVKELLYVLLMTIVLGLAAVLVLCGCSENVVKAPTKYWLCQVLPRPSTGTLDVIPQPNAPDTIYLWDNEKGLMDDDLAWIMGEVQHDYPYYVVVASQFDAPPYDVLVIRLDTTTKTTNYGLSWPHAWYGEAYVAPIMETVGIGWQRCVAETCSHEVGHLLGFEHSAHPWDIMSTHISAGHCACADRKMLNVPHDIVDYPDDVYSPPGCGPTMFRP